MYSVANGKKPTDNSQTNFGEEEAAAIINKTENEMIEELNETKV
jgi:hypothetical protein